MIYCIFNSFIDFNACEKFIAFPTKKKEKLIALRIISNFTQSSAGANFEM